MKYRPEIDGLRAIAVLAVIFSHVGIETFAGGFIGVDVFFVISGYLITSIILRDLDAGAFSLVGFYERRAKRILPALFFVLVCSFVVLWFIATPQSFKGYSNSLIAATLSVSNFYFLDSIDYFAPAATETPLLHTWSLAVEEQFYILFPLVFLFITNNYRRLWTLGGVAIVSFALCLIGARYFPTANYYLLPTRAWELLAGSLLAMLAIRRGKWCSDALGLLGLALILGASMFYHEYLPFPSTYTVVPVVGAMLVLGFAGSGGVSGAILSWPPLRFLGKLSFSAYLWHQVIFVAWRLAGYDDEPYVTKIGLVIVVFLLAQITFYAVESPARYFHTSIRAVLVMSLTAGAICVSLGAWGAIGKGLAFRMSEELKSYFKEAGWNSHCVTIISSPEFELPGLDCVDGPSDAEVKIAIWGDSVSGALSPAIKKLFVRDVTQVTQLSYSSCTPILGVYSSNPDRPHCDLANERALVHIIESDIDAVILAGAWINLLDHPTIYIEGQLVPTHSLAADILREKFDRTVKLLIDHGIKVFLIEPLPLVEFSPAERLARRIIAFGPSTDLTISRSDYVENIKFASSFLAVADRPGFYRVDPQAAFCHAECFLGENGKTYFADRTHVTFAGASKIAEVLKVKLIEAGVLR